MIIRGRLTSVPDDLPVPDGTSGEIVRLNGNVVLATVTTTNGWYEWIVNGNPGKVQVRFDYDGKSKNQWSEITGPSNGVDVGSLWMALNAFSSGRINGFSGNLLVSANGTAMAVTVAAGAALVKGQVYDRYAPGSVAVEAANILPRKDVVIVRCYLNDTGNADEGRTELLVLKGLASSSPVAPTLTNSSTIFDLLLATVDVPANATVISSGNVAPASVFARSYIAPGSITGTEVADGSLTGAEIANGSLTGDKLAESAKILAYVKNGNAVVVADATRIATAEGLIATESTATASQANLAVDFGTGASQVPRGNHTHPVSEIPDKSITGSKIADNTITADKLKDVSLTGNPTLLPGTEYVATGPLSGGSRTLNTLAVGPLLNGVRYDIQAENGVTIRNQVNTGTVVVKVRIAGGPWRTHEFQNVGGVPRWAPVKQSATILGTGATIDVVSAIDYSAADPTDVRAGQVSVIAIPR